jgi:hypothetical protein
VGADVLQDDAHGVEVEALVPASYVEGISLDGQPTSGAVDAIYRAAWAAGIDTVPHGRNAAWMTVEMVAPDPAADTFATVVRASLRNAGAFPADGRSWHLRLSAVILSSLGSAATEGSCPLVSETRRQAPSLRSG